MIGPNYWTHGITVGYAYGNGRHRWSASLEFVDDGFLNDVPELDIVSTQGKLHTRYAIEGGDHVQTLLAAVNAVYRDATRLGIEFKSHYLYADSEDSYQVLDKAGALTTHDFNDVVAAVAGGHHWDHTRPDSVALHAPLGPNLD